MRVLDVGGGTGGWAVPLAESGCQVRVIEPSPNALATLQRRAQEAGVADRVVGTQGDTEALASLVEDGQADLVLGHGLLEVVDDVTSALAALHTAAAHGGAVSVVVANKYAAVLHRALAGKVVDAHRLLDDPDGAPEGTGDTIMRRFDFEGLSDALAAAGLDVELLQGDAVLADLVPGSATEDPGVDEALGQLELVAARTSPLREIATRIHAIGRRA